MHKVYKIINNNSWKHKENDEIILDAQDRNRRRIKLVSKKNIPFLLDERKTIFLKNGALLIYLILIKLRLSLKLNLY